MPTSKPLLMSGGILDMEYNSKNFAVRVEGSNSTAQSQSRLAGVDDDDGQIYTRTLDGSSSDNGGDRRNGMTSDIEVSNGMIYNIEDGEDEHGHSIAGSLWSSSRNFYPSSSIEGTDSIAAHWDFLAIITAVCEAYQRGTYLKMMMLDVRQWEALGEGTTFRVSRSEMKLAAYSLRNNRHKQVFSNRLVIKRNDYGGDITAAQARSFVKELRTLYHLDGHPYIVNLRGIGWFLTADDARHRNVKPAIILEEAFNTLDYLIGVDASVSHGIMLQIFGQITSGLRSLHNCGIAHGDLKPSNILLFKRPVTRDSVQIESFTAKLSDFESVAFRAEGEALLFPPGTFGFRAPEVDEAAQAGGGASVSFTDLVLADTWSLGTVFAVMLSGTEFLQNINPDKRVRQLVEDVNRKLESSSAESEHAKTFLDLLKYTIRIDPMMRRLNEVERLLAPFLEDRDGKQWTDPGPLLLSLDSSLTINYESLKSLASPVKDKIVAELERVSHIRNHPRRPKALWELGIMHLSRFADPDASIDQGLSFLLQSAQEGDIRAKTFCHRFFEAFKRPDPNSNEIVLGHIKEAADAGHRSALEQLWEYNPSAAMKSQISIAESFCQAGEELDLGNTPLHISAATGNENHVVALLARPEHDINHRNDENDTPLMLACRFGRFKVALALLEHGANAKAQNKFGENALHYAWCFNKEEGPIIIRSLVQHGAGLHDISRRKVTMSELDILPVLPGTPVERAAGRVRHDLVLVFIELGSLYGPSNGRLARRLLLWALRLHDTHLVDVLLQSIIFDPSRFDSALAPIIDTKWLHQGKERSLIDAACGGWVSGAGIGCHYPLRIWLIMRHGHGWKHAIYNSISRLKSLEGYYEIDVDTSIQWAFRESLYDALISLVHYKIEIAAIHGLRCPPSNDNHLIWNLGTENTYIIQPQEIYLIDQIFYDTSLGGTLAQQAFISGDRYMFRLLTNKFRANATLPAPMPATSRSSRIGRILLPFSDQVNLYSLLPHTYHQDLWFANELRRLNVSLFCPWDKNPFEQEGFGRHDFDCMYPTPLMHAIATCCKSYIYWLLRYGNASVQDKISANYNLLQMVMSSRSLGMISFFFNGPQPQDENNAILPAEYIADGGSNVLHLFVEANLKVPALSKYLFREALEGVESQEYISNPGEVWDENDPMNHFKTTHASTLGCYWYLLSTYPHAEIVLRESFFEALTEFAQRPYIEDKTALDYFSRIQQEHFSRYRRQSSTYTGSGTLGTNLFSSPLDSLAYKRLHAGMSIIPGMTLDDLSPSLGWFHFRRLWLYIAINVLWALMILWLSLKYKSRVVIDSELVGLGFVFLSSLVLFIAIAMALTMAILSGLLITDLISLKEFARPRSYSYAMLIAYSLMVITISISINLLQILYSFTFAIAAIAAYDAHYPPRSKKIHT